MAVPSFTPESAVPAALCGFEEHEALPNARQDSATQLTYLRVME
jgi:hypothetical protein